MLSYEFRVIPTPVSVGASTGMAKSQNQICDAISDILSDMANQGWEFVRAENVSEQKRHLLIFSKHAQKSCLVFRRVVRDELPAAVIKQLAAEASAQPRLVTPDQVEPSQKPAKLPVLRLENPISIPDRDSHRRVLERLAVRATDNVPEPTENIPAIPRVKSERRARKAPALSALERAVMMENQPV